MTEGGSIIFDLFIFPVFINVYEYVNEKFLAELL